MPNSRRKSIRPVDQTRVRDKRFRRPALSSRRIHSGKITAEEVLIDLKHGSLASLAPYLAQEGGISDRRIAIELRKLISGSHHRSEYRIITIHHPDSPNQGGRPHCDVSQLTEKERQAATLFEENRAIEGKAYMAITRTAEDLGISEATVKRGVRKSQKIKQKQMYMKSIFERRERALKNLRNRNRD